MVDLGIGMIIVIIIIIVFFPSFVSSFFPFPPDFIKCEGTLRWICCEGDVACYVECTKVVKTW